MKGFSEKILPTLFKMVDDLYCSQQRDYSLDSSQLHSSISDLIAAQAEALTDAITSLSKVTPPHVLQNLFAKVLHRVLEASQSTDDQSDKMCSLLALSHALYTSHCLNESSVTLLYRALRPLIGTDETHPRVQKRSYKLLAELCKSKGFVMAEGRLNELVDLLTSSTATSQVSARSMRLRCLEAITTSLQGSAMMEQVRTQEIAPPSCCHLTKTNHSLYVNTSGYSPLCSARCCCASKIQTRGREMQHRVF